MTETHITDLVPDHYQNDPDLPPEDEKNDPTADLPYEDYRREQLIELSEESKEEKTD